jgi:putative nucleotidyltransferase with HDIG domain
MSTAPLPLTREEALSFLRQLNHDSSDIPHYLATEAIMRALAKEWKEDPDYWGILGLLHDVDWSLTKDNQKEHCIKAEELLADKGFQKEEITIIQSHGYGCDQIPALKDRLRTQRIEFALASAETITGLIYAYALMRERRITDMAPSKLKKKFKDKSFAAGCNRTIIQEIEKTGMDMDRFFSIAIQAMQSIKESIGLE